MQGDEVKQSNQRLVRKLLIVVVGMFGFGYALVPLYSVICDAFGINGRFIDIEKGQYTSTEGAKPDKSRTITVQFMASLNQNMPWEFKPLTNKLQLHPGEIKEVKYYAKNLTKKTIVAQAVPSLAPGQAVKYFTKMECFCFNQQTFAAGEGREMPLRFIVDPDLPKHISTITLSYTFFDTNQQAARKDDEQTTQLALKDSSRVYIH